MDYFKNKRIDTLLSNHLNQIESYYKVLSYNQERISDIVYKETIQNEDLMDSLYKAYLLHSTNKNIDKYRKDIEKKLIKPYDSYKSQGVLQYHFVFNDNKVFLRMHKPSKFGDDLSEVRKDFVKTNTTHEVVRGFAQGRTSHAFRNVYPIFYDGIHIGAVEVSFSSELLQNYFTEINKLHTHFLVRKDIFDTHAWSRDDLVTKYQESAEHENYMITMTKEHKAEVCIVQNKQRLTSINKMIHNKMNQNKEFALHQSIKDKSHVYAFYPITHNITKDVVAWIVSYTTSDLISQTKRTVFFIKIILSILVCIIFGFIYFVLNQKTLLKSVVQQKTNYLKTLNTELEESKNNLKHINETLEIRVEQEVEKSRQKDKILFEQSKLASLGEMIGNIAHQWRQPLSLISTSATGVLFFKENGKLSDEHIEKQMNTINDQAQYLSKTIDDFTRFVKSEMETQDFLVSDLMNTTLDLVDATLHNNYIKVVKKIDDDMQINGAKNELEQALINIINNAKDALKEIPEDDRYLFIESEQKDDRLFLYIKDSGGGIDEEIINRIFEPYFTTKHQSKGTGLGLSMVNKIFVERHKFNLNVQNTSFSYKNKTFKGTVFIVEFNKIYKEE